MDVQIADLPEMISVNRKSDCQGQEPGSAKKRPPQKAPVLQPLAAKNAQANVGTKEGKDILIVERNPDLWRVILSQERLNPSIVVLARIDMLHDVPVTLAQRIEVHSSDDVRGAVHIISRCMTEQPPLLL